MMRRSLSPRTGLALAVGLLALTFPLSSRLLGYVTTGHAWRATQISYFVNPQSQWVSPSMATAAVQTAADAWTQQTQANVQFVYAGTTSGSSLTMNGKNEVFFRNDANGGVIAEAYWWWDGSGQLVDADIVFHEGGFHFYAFSGCVDSGVYIEDVATHEFGHVLGLNHSDVGGATMYPTLPSWCDTTQASLDPDDIAGVESLYPPAQIPATPTQLTASQNSSNPASSLKLSWIDNASNETGYQVDRSADGTRFLALASLASNSQSYTDTGLAAGTLYYYRVRAVNGSGSSAFSNSASAQTAAASGPNTAPVVSIATPYAGSLYPAGTTVSFSGSASDTTDGNISSKLVWTSSIDGQIGTGSAFSKALSSGTHTITARATDAGGLTATSQVSVDVAASQLAGPSLSVRGYKAKGLQQAELTWRGLASASIDVYRKGVKVMTTPNDGSQTDAINAKGSGTYTYKVCEAGTATCSPVVTVTF